MIRKTSTKAIINLFDTTAKQDGMYTATDVFDHCDLQRLNNENISTIKFGTLEDNGFLLDGSYVIMDENTSSEDLGYWSKAMSDSTGNYEVVPKIERVFSDNHSAAGLTLYFDKKYSLPSIIKIVFKDAENKIIAEGEFKVNRYDYFCDLKADNFKYMSIEFIKVSPFNYARINGIDYGRKLEYSMDSDKNLSKASLLEELDITSSEVSVNTSSLTVIDYDETFNIDNPQGYYSLLQERQKIQIIETIDDIEYDMATHYIKSWETTSGVISTFKNQDILGVMDGNQFKGNVYENVLAKEIIAELMLSFGWNEFFVDEEVGNVLLSGVIKPMSFRSALQQVAFACGAVVDTSRISGINIYKVSHAIQSIVLSDRKFMSPPHKITQGDLTTDVEVTAHHYRKSNESKEAYKSELKQGVYEITLNEPYSNFAGINCFILNSNPFSLKIQVEVEAEVIINGYPYEDSTTIYRKSLQDLPANAHRNYKQVTGATLISKHNAMDVATTLFEHYQYRLNHEMKIICEDEKVGNYAAVKNKGNMLAVVFNSLSIDLTGGFLATCKGVGYALKLGDYDYAGNELITGDEMGVI